MKTSPFILFLSAAMLAPAFAEPAPTTNATNATQTVLGASARDGFTLRGAEVVMTRNGITTKVAHEVTLPNGTRVRANGNITLGDGSSTALRPNQLLTLEGVFQDVALTPEGVAPVSSVAPGPEPKPGGAVSSKDGIFVSGTEVFITRGGVTEKLTADVRLTNGVTAKPSGIVVMSTGNTVTLRPDQVLDLNGVLHDVPANSRPVGRLPVK